MSLSSYSSIDTQLTVQSLIIAQCNIIKNNYNIMLICHKLVASNEAAVLQACHMSDMQHRQCLSYQRRERLSAAERLIQSYLSLLLSQTPSLCSDASSPPRLRDAVVPMKTTCMQSK